MQRSRAVKHLTLAGLLVVLSTLGAAAGAADLGQDIRLPPEAASVGFQPGADAGLVRETCLECHSADYVTAQPRQTRDGWKAVVSKMTTVFGMAPISTEDETRILDYLVSFYGR
jgi:hypothetical protein